MFFLKMYYSGRWLRLILCKKIKVNPFEIILSAFFGFKYHFNPELKSLITGWKLVLHQLSI